MFPDFFDQFPLHKLASWEIKELGFILTLNALLFSYNIYFDTTNKETEKNIKSITRLRLQNIIITADKHWALKKRKILHNALKMQTL